MRMVALLAFLLTVAIITSSAFIRHAQGGLGCEGWPACYRHVPSGAAPAVLAAPDASVPASAESTASAALTASTIAAPDAARRQAAPKAHTASPISTARLVHRASAAAVGLLAIALAVFGWNSFGPAQRAASMLALAITAGLAWLGRYTPHALPAVTVGNVLGGLTLAAAFALVAAARNDNARSAVRFRNQPSPRPATRPPGQHATGQGAARTYDLVCVLSAAAALVMICLLGWLGVMIGANHGADACVAASCVADTRLDFRALDPLRTEPTLDLAALQGLHLVHRLAAGAFIVVVGGLAWRIMRSPRAPAGHTRQGRSQLRRLNGAAAFALLLLTALQVLTGSATARELLDLSPLAGATLHSAIAALLAGALAAAGMAYFDSDPQ